MLVSHAGYGSLNKGYKYHAYHSIILKICNLSTAKLQVRKSIQGKSSIVSKNRPVLNDLGNYSKNILAMWICNEQ